MPSRRRDLSDEAAAIHRESIVIDGSIVVRYEAGHFDRTAKGGVTAVNHTVSDPESGLRGTLSAMTKGLQFIQSHPTKTLLVQRVEDVLEAKQSKRVGIIFGPQDADFLEYDLGLLQTFHRFGLRILQIAYQRRNLIGDGCGESRPTGLSELGHQVIREMNRLGIVIDLSHCSKPTTDEAIEATTKPPIFSHTNPATRAKHIRSKTDDQIHHLAEKGGVMGLTAYSPITEVKKGVRPTMKDFLGHIEYVADLVGVEHVGIGSDVNERSTPEKWDEFRAKYPELSGGYDWEGRRVTGFEDITAFPEITLGLLELGYTKQEIKGILGENFLRVFDKNWT